MAQHPRPVVVAHPLGLGALPVRWSARDRPTKHAKATVPIGLYHVWTERDDRATSPKDAWFQIIREHERIKICESRSSSKTPRD